MIGVSVVNSESKSLSREPMRVFRRRLHFEEVHNVDESDLEVGELFPQQHCRRQRLLSRNVARRCHHQVRLTTLVVAGPVPNADSFRTVLDCGIHVQVLQMELLVGNDHVDVVLAPQTVIRNGEETVRVGRQIDAGYGRALVENHVEEARILVREPVMILTPYG